MLSAHWLRVSSVQEEIIVMQISPLLSIFPNKLGANEDVGLMREKSELLKQRLVQTK